MPRRNFNDLIAFLTVAREGNFTRSASTLGITQSALSQAIKSLEAHLKIRLFTRTTCSVSLTEAGDRLFAAISGRFEVPEIELHIAEVTFSEQLHGLRDGDFVCGLAHTANVGGDIVAEPLWQDPLGVAVPTRHPLLVYPSIPLYVLAGYPLILCDWQVGELSRFLHPLEDDVYVVEPVSSHDMMLALVGAGYDIGFITINRFALCRRSDVVVRPLAGDSAVMTTYLLQPDNANSAALLARFIARLHER